MAHLASWKVVLIQLLFNQLCITATKDQNYKKGEVQTERIEIDRGTRKYNLSCKESNRTIIWKKNGQRVFVSENDKSGLTHPYKLHCVDKKDEGIYTCHPEKDGPPLKRFDVQVTLNNTFDLCGKEKKEIVEKDGFECPPYLETDYPCCKYAAPNGPKRMTTTLKLSSQFAKGDNYCHIYNGIDNYKNPWEILVDWQVRATGKIYCAFIN
ncbi:uncharacterized protein LOC114529209 [Dendronephthya gigantea]|uniref:uncharacterized protein LOC114529209 n=1 Tax=Dendronephthya gigantea TaxID=151771 RepID=UPI00106D37A5|nr:uncharacterized protein LOC114529209 [Dendronephthya gigantea]